MWKNLVWESGWVLKRGKVDKGEGDRAFEMILQNSRPRKGLGFIEGQWEVTEGL